MNDRAATCLVAKDCIPLPKYRKPMRYEKHQNYMTTVRKLLFLIYDRQVLSRESDFGAGKQIFGYAKRYFKAVKETVMQNRLDV